MSTNQLNPTSMESTDEYRCIFQHADHWARQTPAAEAIVFHDRRMNYAKLSQAVDSMARAFLAAGVQPGDRIAMIAMACPEFMITFLAASKVGAVWLGLNPKMSARELNYILSDCQPRLLFTLDAYGGKPLFDELKSVDLKAAGVEQTIVMGQHWEGTVTLEQFTADLPATLEYELTRRSAQVGSDDDVLLMYTSGSTGQPKGVIQTHRSILINVREQARYFFMDQNTRALLHFPINHVAADVEIGYATIFAGGALVMMDRFDPAGTLEILGREKVTMWGQIPAMFLMQATLSTFAQTDFSSLKALVWGGAAAPMKLLRGLQQISQATGAKLITGYGSTEACGFITYTNPDDPLDQLATSVGRAPKGFELKIVDDQRQTVSAGILGELAIRGPFLFKEYWNKADATATAKDSDGWFYTGDLGYLDQSGSLYLNGRKSEMFKTGGENVFPREIEDVLCEHPSVALAAVIGIPDPLFQEVGHALVVPRPGCVVTAEQLKQHCHAHLINFKVPKAIEVRAALPLLPNGKVNKLELKREIVPNSN